jgi:ABC-type phosphate transport system substrate-binding protein
MKSPLDFRCLWAACALLACSSSFAQVAVVASPKNAAASMTAEQVSSIFMGKSNTLPSGATALAVDLPEASPVREQFYSKVAGKSGAQVKAAWSRLVFSGKATPRRRWPAPPR